MRFATSFFNATLLKKNWQRFWPIWGLYSVIWLLQMPVNLLLTAAEYSQDNAWQATALQHTAQRFGTCGEAVLYLAVVFGLLAGVAVFSYLFSARSTGGIHTLPIRREGLFLTNYVSGLGFLLIPNVAVFLLTLLVEAATGCLCVSSLLAWLGISCGCCFFFFSLAVLCAVLTGHVVAAPAFYLIANILAYGFVFLLEQVLSTFVFGFNGLAGLEKAAAWLTPVVTLTRRVNDYSIDGNVLTFRGSGTVAVYVAAAVVLTVLALLFYRRRQMERAGDVVASGWLRPVFRFGVAACCALAFGVFFYWMFRSALVSASFAGVWPLLICMAVCGAAGYFIASMLLEKSIRVFHHWKGCMVFLLVLAGLTCLMEYDAFGFERRVPDREDVAFVSVSRIDCYPYDSGYPASLETDSGEVIDLLLTAHRDIVANKERLEQGMTARGSLSGDATSLSVTYHLKNGRTMNRSYDVLSFSKAELEDTNTFAGVLEKLINLPEAIEAGYGLGGLTEEDISMFELMVYTDKGKEEQSMDVPTMKELEEMGFGSMEEYQQYYAEASQVGENVSISDRADVALLWSAVQQDFAEGGLGRRTLNAQRDDRYIRNNSFNIECRYSVLNQETGTSDYSYSYKQITLQTTAEHTLQALRELGVLDENHYLITDSGEKLY